MGRSLGGAVAASAACHLGPRALVIDSSFSSLRDMAARAVFFLPWSWLLDEPMDSEAAVAAYKGPVFVAHGDGDRTIPFRFGRRLYAAASGPKFFFRIAGGDHNDPMPENCFKALEEFLGGENVLKE